MMRAEEIKNIALDLKKISQAYGEVAKVTNNFTKEIGFVKRLIDGSKNKNSLGSKMITAGLACLAFPEPFISDIIGLTMIAAGSLIVRASGPTIRDILKEYKKIVFDLKKINESVL